MPCPEGASCKGSVTWGKVRVVETRANGSTSYVDLGVTAKFGWWRINKASNTHDQDSQQPPPPCVTMAPGGAKCALFRPCLFPAACLGAKNKDEHAGRFFDEKGKVDLSTISTAEGCDASRGYANNCSDYGSSGSRCVYGFV